jgi:hypothetical protein
VPRGSAYLWDRERLSAETLDLLAAVGDRVLAAMISDQVPAREAPVLYADLAARRRSVLQAVLVDFG